MNDNYCERLARDIAFAIVSDPDLFTDRSVRGELAERAGYLELVIQNVLTPHENPEGETDDRDE